MKLVAFAPVVVTLATAWITGCGPGLTTRANAPTDAKLAMDSSLSQELIGTTALTSAPLPLPSTRAKLDPWSPPDSAVPSAAAVAPMQTWGADPELDPKYNPEYGF
jgi:hypothetical protein